MIEGNDYLLSLIYAYTMQLIRNNIAPSNEKTRYYFPIKLIRVILTIRYRIRIGQEYNCVSSRVKYNDGTLLYKGKI
jgi:hypothetical protein